MSDTVKSTEQDRLEQLRGLLSGSRAQDCVGRALASGPYGNVLLGAMLHGADRKRQGKTPTDLEQVLLDALGEVLPDAEMRQWGGVYREAVAAQGRLTTVPETITRRTVGQGYALADLRQDLQPVIDEALASANVQILDPFAAAEGQGDDQAFLEAMRERKFAVTAYARAAEPMPNAEAPAAFRAKLEMESFYVDRTVGDGAGGDDEIYWTAATSAGKGTGGTFKSQEFKAVKKGQTFTFASSNRLLFDQSTDGFLSASIQCWEKDQSNQAWYNELAKALLDALKVIDLYMTVDGLSFGGVPLWAGMAFEIAKIFLFVMEVWRNFDDLSCDRMIGLDRHDLSVMYHRGHANWNFNGDGYHTLRVKYSGTRPAFPAATLEIARTTPNNTSWDMIPVSLDWQSVTPPAMAVYQNKLHAVFSRPGDNALMWSRLNGTTWSRPAHVKESFSVRQAALAVTDGKLVCYLTSLDGWSRIVKFDGASWATPVDGWIPSLFDVTDDADYSAGFAGVDFRVQHPAGQPGLEPVGSNPAENAPALFKHNDALWIAYRKHGDTVGMAYRARIEFPRPKWNDQPSPVATWRTADSPAVVAHEGRTYLVVRGLTGGKLYMSSSDGGPWAASTSVSHATIATLEQPALASYQGSVYVMYRR
ncbi:hypothetical protein AB0C81_13775 [Streptomyces roseoverticillatus]|uniref:hypothetical protein n=1 Tax=Streptomyces roseoverticillatus TaxID=66429 RepID=UPI0033F23C77